VKVTRKDMAGIKVDRRRIRPLLEDGGGLLETAKAVQQKIVARIETGDLETLRRLFLKQLLQITSASFWGSLNADGSEEELMEALSVYSPAAQDDDLTFLETIHRTIRNRLLSDVSVCRKTALLITDDFTALPGGVLVLVVTDQDTWIKITELLLDICRRMERLKARIWIRKPTPAFITQVSKNYMIVNDSDLFVAAAVEKRYAYSADPSMFLLNEPT
jgi:hypothetical protein